ncbi:MAG: universal stress protein [Solirubrobacteraceae bacterium]
MTDPSEPHKIVVGVDGSAPSIDALRWAVRQAQLTGSFVQAMMAWRYPAGVIPAGAEDLAAESRRAVDGAIEGAFAGAPPVQIIRVVDEGGPALTLVGRSKDAALLVIGSRGHGAFVGMLIGSVSQYCVTHAHCPVVVLRGPEG